METENERSIKREGRVRKNLTISVTELVTATMSARASAVNQQEATNKSASRKAVRHVLGNGCMGVLLLSSGGDLVRLSQLIPDRELRQVTCSPKVGPSIMRV